MQKYKDINEFSRKFDLPFCAADFSFNSKILSININDPIISDIEASCCILPNNFTESQKVPEHTEWFNAMIDEIATLNARKAFIEVRRPEDKENFSIKVGV